MESTSAKQLRDRQRAAWRAAAPGWVRWDDAATAAGKPLTNRLVELAGARRGNRVLDLACGMGNPAFRIAEIVGPEGYVLGLDLSPEIIAGAKQLASQRAIANVEFRKIESELALGVEPASFDAATCRCGLMFMAYPAAALRTLGQALRPRCRLAVSTWGAPERSPFLTFVDEVVRRHVALPPSNPATSDPFGLTTPVGMRRLFQEAGMDDVEVVSLKIAPLVAPTAAQYWQAIRDMAGGLELLLAPLSAAERATFDADAIQTIERLHPSTPIKFTAEVLISAGARLS